MLRRIFIKIVISLRRIKYFLLSGNSHIHGKLNKHQPVLFNGLGGIRFGNNVNIGVFSSPKFYNGYAYIEARTKNASIIFGDDIHINNEFSAIAEKSISIGNRVLIGYNCSISDSDFHNLEIDKRMETDPAPKAVVIGDNVFIANNVTILKGVTLGENSVVASGAVVTKSFPANSVIGGVPAKSISSL